MSNVNAYSVQAHANSAYQQVNAYLVLKDSTYKPLISV